MFIVHAIAYAQIKGTAVGTSVAPYQWGVLEVVISEAIKGFKFPENGQGMITLPGSACDLVTSGVVNIRKVSCSKRAVLHRGEWILVADRDTVHPQSALRPNRVDVIVYTKEAYLADPQLTEAERVAFAQSGCEYALITILASPEGKPSISSHRFVRNLAGGNNAFLTMSGDEIRAKAAEIAEYENTYMTVG